MEKKEISRIEDEVAGTSNVEGKEEQSKHITRMLKDIFTRIEQ